jgi:hypothetical protein
MDPNAMAFTLNHKIGKDKGHIIWRNIYAFFKYNFDDTSGAPMLGFMLIVMKSPKP